MNKKLLAVFKTIKSHIKHLVNVHIPRAWKEEKEIWVAKCCQGYCEYHHDPRSKGYGDHKIKMNSTKKQPTLFDIAVAKAEISKENEEDFKAQQSLFKTIERQLNLPPEHPDHTCGLHCDGQDGINSECARLRRKLFG